MAIIGSLSVSVIAKTKKFQKGMKNARKSISKFANKIPFANTSVLKMGSILTAVALGGMVILTKRSLALVDATAKLADTLGTTTEDLAGLRLASELAGAPVGTLDKALEKMTKGLGEARINTGQAKFGLEILGLALEDLIGLNPAEQFAKIADATKELAFQEDKVAAASLLFGRAGVKLVKTLELGSEGLAASKKEAIALGIAFSRVDAAKVEDANDAITRLKKLFEGLGNQLAIVLSPFIEDVTRRMVNFGTAGGGVSALVSDGVKTIVLGLAKMADFLQIVIAGWNLFKFAVQIALFTSLQPLNLLLKGLVKIAKITGVGFAIDGISALSESIDILSESTLKLAKKDLNKAAKNFANFQEGAFSAKVEAAFDRIAANATKRAEAISKGVNKAFIGPRLDRRKDTFAPPRDKDISEGLKGAAKEIVLSRVFLGGGGGGRRQQEVRDREGEKLLQQIVKNTQGSLLGGIG